MKLSVITVVYNGEKSLCKAVYSVVSNNYPEFEYVIIDGGSTDGTLEVVRAVAESDPRISWISEPDKGIADAFNKGLKMATGDWIGILNSDDCYTPETLKLVAAAIEENPDADVIHGNLLRIDEDGNPLFELRPADLDSSVWHLMPLNHMTMFVSRKAYEKVGGFDKELKIAMDYDLVLRLYKSGAKFIYLDHVLAHMRYGGASDDRFLLGLKEIWKVSVREGYPMWKATFWMLFRGVVGMVKVVLRKLGLSRLMLLHPRFHGRNGSGGAP